MINSIKFNQLSNKFSLSVCLPGYVPDPNGEYGSCFRNDTGNPVNNLVMCFFHKKQDNHLLCFLLIIRT